MRKTRRFSFAWFLLFLFMLLCLAAVGYGLYITLSWHRIPDNEPLSIERSSSQPVVPNGKEHILLTWNTAFGAADPSFSWWYANPRGTLVRGASEEQVKKNLESMAETIEKENPDFVLLQQVDSKADRSFLIDEREFFQDRMDGYCSVWAPTLHTAYLIWPRKQPSGSTESGLLTLSNRPGESAVRHSLPSVTSVPEKFSSPDAAVTAMAVPTENGRNLILLNCDISEPKDEQYEALFTLLASYAEGGSYVIAGGDLALSSLPADRLPGGFSVAAGGSEATERLLSEPYGEGTPVAVSDGFIVGPGVTAAARVLDTGFQASSHNPVLLSFRLE